MTYSPQTWVDNNASYPLSAARMNNIEAGIEDAAAVADQGHQILTTAQRDALTGVATGTMIYNSTTSKIEAYTGSAWIEVGNLSTTSGVTGVSSLIVPPACRVTRTTQQTLANATLYALNFTASATYDTDGMVGATKTFVTINTPGIYMVSAGVGFGAVIAGARTLYLRVNPTLTGSGDATTATGGTAIGGVLLTGTGSTTTETTLSVTGCYNFVAGDKISALVYQASGGNLNTDNSGGTFMSVTWVGRSS